MINLLTPTSSDRRPSSGEKNGPSGLKMKLSPGSGTRAGELKRRHNRLEIEVDNPKIDHAYYFEWTPPIECDVPEPQRGSLNRGV